MFFSYGIGSFPRGFLLEIVHFEGNVDGVGDCWKAEIEKPIERSKFYHLNKKKSNI